MNRDVSPFYLAMIYSGLGDKEQALKWLESAYEERYNWLVWLRTEQMFESLRGEGMFIELAQRIGLDDR
jgi:hypothetical protein